MGGAKRDIIDPVGAVTGRKDHVASYSLNPGSMLVGPDPEDPAAPVTKAKKPRYQTVAPGSNPVFSNTDPTLLG